MWLGSLWLRLARCWLLALTEGSCGAAAHFRAEFGWGRGVGSSVLQGGEVVWASPEHLAIVSTAEIHLVVWWCERASSVAASCTKSTA
jgi:hypothetical protein